MPYNTFTPNTTIQSSKINENFQASVHGSDVQKITNKVPVPSVVTDNSGAFDLDTASWLRRVLDGTNGALSLTNDDTDQLFIVELVQDSTGSRTVTWFSGISWAGGVEPVLTTTANKRDVFGFRVTTAGSAYIGFIVGINI